MYFGLGVIFGAKQSFLHSEEFTWNKMFYYVLSLSRSICHSAEEGGE